MLIKSYKINQNARKFFIISRDEDDNDLNNNNKKNYWLADVIRSVVAYFVLSSCS